MGYYHPPSTGCMHLHLSMEIPILARDICQGHLRLGVIVQDPLFHRRPILRPLPLSWCSVDVHVRMCFATAWLAEEREAETESDCEVLDGLDYSPWRYGDWWRHDWDGRLDSRLDNSDRLWRCCSAFLCFWWEVKTAEEIVFLSRLRCSFSGRTSILEALLWLDF